LNRYVRYAAAFAAAALMCASALAQYPTHAIKWIVPYPPAGTTDTLARIMAQYMSEKLGQQVVIENKPGGGNNIGTEFAAKSPPDGYTIFLVNPANAINATLYPKLNFNFLEDMAPVAGIVRVPNVMTVTKNFPAKTVAEFIEYGKKNPDKINMASSGAGTSVHLSGELFKSMAGINMKHVPYKGAGPATTSLVNGEVNFSFQGQATAQPFVKVNKLIALAVTGRTPSPMYPGVPTMEAAGVKDFEMSDWNGILAPAGTPPAIVHRINAEMVKFLSLPETKAKLAQMGFEGRPGTPEEFGAFIRSELAKWNQAAKAAHIKAD
jgi:tripartite-type tricarboxylate transporter receptor subunit TctC